MGKDLNKLIGTVLKEHGELGVTSISRLVDVPVTTVHRFLTNQDYYIKNGKKWRLPIELAEGVDIETLWPYKRLEQIVELDKFDTMEKLFNKTGMEDLQLYIRVENILKEYAELLLQRAAYVHARGRAIVDGLYNTE